MLQQSDLKILSSLRQKSLEGSEISERTGLASGTVRRRVATLREQELVERLETTEGSKIFYRRQQSDVATALDTAADSVPHVDLPDFLTPSLLTVLYWVEKPLGPSEIATRVDLSRVRVQQLLSTLVRRQFVTKPDRGHYELKSEYKKLGRLAEAVARHTQRVEIKPVFPDATIVWAAPCEALVVPGESTKGLADELVDDTEWTVTGLAAFPQFGFDFTVADAPLLYRNTAEKTGDLQVHPAEAVCHALCRRIEHRLVRFCILVVLDGVMRGEISLTGLQETASIYGMEREIEALVTFVEQRGDSNVLPTDLSSSFPSWQRVVDTGTQYDLDVERAVSQLPEETGES
ncbi:helix-turn-helix domain-containing protein [Halomicroarcula sp. F13]|uniref:Helix-turn-helix domain-containing protein n=1 Tax=Haloarcula rubra TaxID=2487747 RepID=A0AAW4PVF8_9EURY|nr:helix-turn-helix domain-containing protein [Halomicroarcula rubra]MBX0325673.1 helix-turn-helix domain-containing protein [Halomicroarcula rubra]